MIIRNCSTHGVCECMDDGKKDKLAATKKKRIM